MRKAVSPLKAGMAMFVLSGLFAVTAVAEDQPRESNPMVVEADADGIQRASITLDSYSYTPNHLVIQVGKPVELELTSVTILTPHNFIVKEPGADLMVDRNVSAGKRVVIRFTPNQAGVFPFYCDKKLLFFKSHREKGMEGRLEVR
ncbi:MAG: cupredoxin domain-containing protein [Nitrospiraceae bacterium]